MKIGKLRNRQQSLLQCAIVQTTCGLVLMQLVYISYMWKEVVSKFVGCHNYMLGRKAQETGAQMLLPTELV